MSDRMRTLPFGRLLEWMTGEYEQHGSIFGIPETLFFRYSGGLPPTAIPGGNIEAPFGPAAGPHTQLAQNIICSYLTGCRFMELKTVQKLDSLEFEKPCIDAFDEGYNTEWSQELSLEESFDEYLKAWLAIHLLDEKLGLSRGGNGPGFLFNMSVGYDLEGIRSERMDRFIDGMVRPLVHRETRKRYEAYRALLSGDGAGANRTDIPDPVEGFVHSVTISTMHGCPPGEIESMATYLMVEKGLHTYVKLNPTLLGGECARDILRRCGWGHIEIENAVFENDLGYPHAVELIRNLQAEAVSRGRHFGVKLSNTLANTNTGSVLPGEERYMSGRALFPLTVNLAHKLASEFDGNINISYSGGASVVNIAQLLRTGIRPVTMATDMLKPGGYGRFRQIAHELECEWKGDAPPGGEIDVSRLRAMAEDALQNTCYRKDSGKARSIKLGSRLGLFDCVTAPCIHACPIHQDIPAYIEAVGRGETKRALEIIMRNNPLPNITGYICDHECMEKCVRWDYDNPLGIRAIKRFAAAAHDGEAVLKEPGEPVGESKPAASAAASIAETSAAAAQSAEATAAAASIAVVGGGPAGLACSFFLAREGFSVSIFERHADMGGTVRHAIPRFRLPDTVIDRDISLIQGLGVTFNTGWSEKLSIDGFFKRGFSYVLLATGSGVARKLDLPGSHGVAGYYTGIDFLHMIKRGETPFVGKNVLVIGGGNSAVDAARAVLRLGSGTARIVYRRDLANMPADREEIDACIEERISIDELLSPLELITENGSIKGLRCARMKLGEIDESGRRRPLPVEGEELLIEADTVIAAIGEEVEIRSLKKNRIELNDGRTVLVNSETGETSMPGVYAAGDCVRGPATVVEAIADAKTVARSIMKAEGLPRQPLPRQSLPHEALNDRMYEPPSAERIAENMPRRAAVSFFEPVKTLPLNKRKGFETVIQTLNGQDAKRESERCLHCSEFCSKCVEVCPNRANLTLFMDPADLDARVGRAFFQDTQILHVDDFCNECGNCETFCVHEGKPYMVKPTLFSSEKPFSESKNSGFYYKYRGEHGHCFVCRLDGHVYDMYIDGDEVRFSRDADMEGMVGLSLIARNLLSHHTYLLT